MTIRIHADSLLATESQIPYVTSELLAAIEAGVVLRDQGPSKTVKVSLSNQNAVVRYGTNVSLGEANVLRLLSTAFAPGSVPVPRVIGTWWSSSSQDTRQTLYIVTEWVNGESLEDIWPQLQSSDKDALAARLSDILRCIRLVKPEGNPYIGAVDHLPCNDDFLRGMGPFTDMDAFIEAFKHVCRPYARGHYMRVLDRLLVRWRSYSVVLTHGDLCPDNILVCRTPDGNSWTVAAIVDWELAGWYPEHWEYVTLLNCVKWCSDWSSVAQDLLPTKYDDDFILDSKYRFYLR
ncbi:kinase-like protein [Fistulina hepatica ATCC 64428]|uniref:Kinase-like protein n=1 Tax=Fistulina hepatica ATCC 64428 TaxID=1128425 RepID=A0A0D7AK16_9AGAR|nr:kinase-like protein [Fistulina hepatica ATCC 64428]